MNESISSENYPLLKRFSNFREGLSQKELSINLLTAQVGSQHLQVADEAKRQLRTKWELEPDKDAENAKTVDILDQLGKFTEEEGLLMASQVAGLQLTEGCNGNCSFCFFGRKKGVEAKYSFESVSAFLRKYKEVIPKDLYFYWDSDPFDYRDGKYGFTDVYKVWREINPTEHHFVSTSIPRGGQNDFIDFMKNAIDEYRSKGSNDPKLKVRVSVGEHNSQRVEATFVKLTEVLLKEGYSSQEINVFYSGVDFGARLEDGQGISNLGPLISKHDDIKDTSTPSCKDGVVITPKSCKAVMVTAPTIYEPAGEKDIEILPGRVKNQTPLLNFTAGLGVIGNELNDFIQAKRPIMIDVIRAANREEYELPDKIEDLVLKLGRNVYLMGGLRENFAHVGFAKPEDKDKYLKVSAQAFRDRQVGIERQILLAKEYCSTNTLSSEESEKTKFYILLADTYLEEMDFLANQVENGLSFWAVKRMARAFGEIGRENLNNLPKLIKELTWKGRRIKIEQGVEKVKDKFLSIVRKTFDANRNK